MVSVAWSTSIPRGDLPTFTVGGVFAQPEVCSALQVAASITETLLSTLLATYTVSVAWSMATPVGALPT
jgi:hypothetical protein